MLREVEELIGREGNCYTKKEIKEEEEEVLIINYNTNLKITVFSVSL